MKLSEFQRVSARTLNNPGMREKFEDARAYECAARLAMALGLTGEAGEVADLVKKIEWHAREQPVAELEKELGDVLWYLAAVATLYGVDLDDVARINVEKLQKRFPDGFTTAASIAKADER